ncbi:PAS domain-containing serine/threonine-protein kinase-like isoform X1 [Acropora millepora]|uniref:PAS domain-containing serine/threonine-protein kinase-like isoform X1 n=1 Tax=Acropora millepora TaxID=45264 RepID=UPI001CF5CA8E|nr:PAS domain-containing serine/threonine-protein kinase-like isoform X1 [Acropora millepora]
MATNSKCPLPPRPQSVPLLRKTMSPDPTNAKSSPTRSKTPLNKFLGKSLNLKSSLGGNFLFGTPSYPSPLDRIRSTKIERAIELGLSTQLQDSLDLNATFPKMYKAKARHGEHQLDVFKSSRNLDQISSDSLHSFSFSPGHCRGSFVEAAADLRLSTSWQFYNFVGGAATGSVFPTTVRNPNKAILTINARTSEILTANDMAAELFSYSRQQLIGIKLLDLFADTHKEKQETLMEQHVEASGAVVMVSGKVLEAIDSCGIVFPVSVWMKKLTWEDEPRCIAVMEPVERRTAMVLFDSQGFIVSCDSDFAILHGYHGTGDLKDVNIRKLIPALELPTGETMSKHVKKQRATGRTKDGATFPLSISLKTKHGKDLKNLDGDKEFSDSQLFFKAMVWVFANISGLVTLTPEGLIHSCNQNFSLLLFGYQEKELVGKQIVDVIPNFYDDMDDVDDNSMPLPPFDDEDDEIDDDDFCVANERKSTVIYSRELDSKGSNVSEGNLDDIDFEDSVSSSSLNTSTGLSSSRSTTDSSRSNKNTTQDHSSAPMDSILLEKESIVANYGDSRVENSFSGSSFASFESGSSTPKTCAEDSGIDDRSASLEKVRLEIGKDGLCKTDGTLKVSSPPGAGVLSLDSQGEEKKSLTSSFIDQDAGELCLEDIENETESAVKKAPSDQQLFESPDRSTNTSQGYSNESASDNHSSVERSFVNSNSAGESGAETESQDNSETCSNQNSSENYSSELTSVESSGISKIQSDNSDLKDTGSSANSSEVYSGHSTNESLPSAELSLAESQNQAESNGMPQTPPDGCDLNLEGLTSTPNLVTRVEHTDVVSPHQPVCEGSFVGKARHKDGSLLGIIFQVKKMELNSGQVLYCAWISRDPAEEGEGGRSTSSFALASSFNSTSPLDYSVASIAELPQYLNESSAKETDSSPGRGRYDERYITLQSIGKGAFGFVKVGQRKSDGSKVIVKFIRKTKILADCWVDDPMLGSIPLEIALLAKLKHPNIVEMLEAFENEEFFQLVMEKHGSGMDLFEFIDRQPALDEPLCSYLFRQVVSAVSFLHSKSILHRDVKDENIILDDKFHIKLIDFGSAAYMEEGKKFCTFCGTMEYCSPEVLMGNSYSGPELELWSIGVTLYTLVFGENPFYDIEETIRAELHPPFSVSHDLLFVICWLLHPDPRWRATMSDLEENDWINQTIDIKKYSFEAVLGDQLDGTGLQYSQSDGDISQDEVIDYANQEENNQQLSALQEYLSMIDGEDDVSNDET